jgi:hypothetical protein
MCFLAILHRVVPDYPVVLAANRDEMRDRPGLPPRELAPGICGGQDPRAGGTWLGVSAGGLVAAVANIVGGGPPNPAAKSRGLLCLGVLGLREVSRFPQFLRNELEAGAFNPFNLVVAGVSGGWAASFARGELKLSPLSPGLHLIGNSLPDEKDDPKIAAGRRLISVSEDIDEALAGLMAACRHHGDRSNRADAICVHAPAYGTLSSSLLALHEKFPNGSRYLHADGPPCETPYRDLSNFFLPNARESGT